VIPTAARGTAVIGTNAAIRCASLYQKPVSSRDSQPDAPAASMNKKTRKTWLTSSQRSREILSNR